MLSLENLCFSSIVKEFERFHISFKVSNDYTLKRNFEFLKRKYSFELASKLFEEGNLEDKYLDILLNEHLKEFNGCWLTGNHNLTLSEDILRRLPNITKFSLPIRCCDEDVRYIAKFCPKLAEIDVKESGVTDAGIRYLCKDENGKRPCPELRKLFIEGCRITDEGIKYLIQNLPSLESVDCNVTIPRLLYSLHKEGYENVYAYNLTSLSFSEVNSVPYFTDILKICLSVCPKLKSLECCRISDDQQLNLLNNASLERLDLQFSRTAPKINVNNFLKSNGCNLTFLGIEHCIISINELAVNCPKLNYLCINDVTFTDNDDSQPVFHYLDKCNFWNMKHDSATIKGMRSILLFSPKLESVGFTNCILSPDTKTDVLKCFENCLIKQILFMWTIVDVNFLKDILLNCHSLIILYLYKGTYINLNEVVKLARTLPNKPQIKINIWPYKFFAS